MSDVMCYLTLAFLLGLVSSQTPVTVETRYGKVQGMRMGPTTSYLGVPYAKPPTGQLRFRPPETPDPWTDVKVTTDYKSACYQRTPNIFDVVDVSEDCLYLNVFVPDVPDNEQIPVMVWLHGGTLNRGSASQYPGTFLAAAGQVIVVNLNYRLGVFGFLTTGDGVIESNIGLLDQVKALEWVQENIHVFGGDKSRVSLFGESAGSWSAHLHTVSPMSSGLFQRVILQSGTISGVPIHTDTERANFTFHLAKNLGCDSGSSSSEALTCLQQLRVSDFIPFLSTDPLVSTLGVFPVSYGGQFLPNHPDDMNFTGNMDFMLGVNSDEGLISFLNLTTTDQIQEYLTEGISIDDPQFGIFASLALSALETANGETPILSEDNPIYRALFNHYIDDQDDKIQNMRGVLDMMTDSFVFASTVKTLQKAVDSGQKAYLYYFNHIDFHGLGNASTLQTGLQTFYPTLNEALPIGAAHGAEISFIFGWSSFYEFGKASQEVENSMMMAWVSFAKTGSPIFNTTWGQILPWPEYDENEEKYIEFKHPMTATSVRSRLRPSAASLFSTLLPAYDEKLSDNKEDNNIDDKDGDINGDSGSDEKKTDDPEEDVKNDSDPGMMGDEPAKCIEGDHVSTINRDKAETALFILSALVIVLLIFSIVIVMNYYSLKKELMKIPKDTDSQNSADRESNL